MTFHSHARKPKLGTWLVSCDVCGIIHLNTQVKKRWDNLFVCEDDWEKDHPQKFIKLPRERIAAPFERVESVDGTGNSFIPLCTVFSNQAVAGAAEAGCSVAGTWRLVDNGGSLLTPPSTPSGPSELYPDYTSLMYLFRGEGLANNRLANTAPAYLSVFQPSGTAEGLSNQVGYFSVGTSWPANSDRTGWNTLSSGSFPAGAIDTINFSAGCWYFSPTVGDNGRGFVLFNFNNQVNMQLRVFSGSVVFTVQSQYWVSNVNDISPPLDLVGWNHVWFRVDNGVVTLYLNGVSFYTTTITLNNPSIRFYIPTQPTMEILNVLENHITGSVDELVFLRNIGIPPPPTSAPFPITPAPPPAPGAQRFWRLVNFTIPGGGFLEISELRLTVSGIDQLDGTMSSSTLPSFNTIAEIYDNNLFTRTFWPEATVENPGFSITWEYPSSRLITGFKQAGFDTSNRYIRDCTCQSSDDGITWTTYGSASGLTYPGNNILSSNILFVPSNAQPFIHWRILATSNDGDATYTSIGEVELLVSASDITGSVTSSGQSTSNGGSETAAQTIDNNPNTEWVTSAGNALPSWVAYSFASAVTPTQLSIRSQRIVTGRTPTTFKLQGNDTGRGPSDPWVDVLTVTGSTGWGVQETRVFNI